MSRPGHFNSNNIPANTDSNLHPEDFMMTDHDGIGAFVVLDYSISSPRFEHAIVVMPEHWNSMYQLLVQPGFFMDRWRRRYASTPSIPISTSTNILPPAMWDFESPITIVLEPLTVPTPANWMFLKALAPLYPSLTGASPNCLFGANGMPKGPNVPFGTPTTVRDSKSNFADLVINALTFDVGNPPKQATIDYWSNHFHSAPYSFQYIAEFALRTRTLTIRYLPRSATNQNDVLFNTPQIIDTSVHPNEIKDLGDSITAITENRVDGTNLTFLHFDIALNPAKKTSNTPKDYGEMTDKRARFVMNLISDEDFLNNVKINPHESTTTNDPTNGALFLDTNTKFFASSKALSLPANQPGLKTTLNPFTAKPKFVWWGAPPSVIIDSVLPFANEDPVPFPCVLIPTTPISPPTSPEYPLTTVTVKAYEP